MSNKKTELGEFCEHGLPRKFCTSAEHLPKLQRYGNDPLVVFVGLVLLMLMFFVTVFCIAVWLG